MSAYAHELDESRAERRHMSSSERALGQSDCRHLPGSAAICPDCGLDVRAEVNP